MIGTSIDTIESSRKRFYKWDQKKADRARGFQHAEGFLWDDITSYSYSANGIKSDSMARRNMGTYKDM